MQIRRVLALSAAAVFVASVSSSVLAQRNAPTNRPQRSPQEQQDVDALFRTVDDSMMKQPLVGAPVGMPAPGAAPAVPAAPAAPAGPAKPFGASELSQGDIPVKWESNHFLKGPEGNTYIAYTLAVDRTALPAKNAALYVRIVDEAQAQGFSDWVVAMTTPPAVNKDAKGPPPAPPTRPAVAWEYLNFVELPDDGRVARAIQLKPGKYVAYLTVKEKSTTAPPKNPPKNAPPAPPVKIGLLRRELVVPEYNAVDLSASSVILAKSIEALAKPLTAQEQESNPYVLGPLRIVPQEDGKFAKAGQFNLIFFVYGAREAAAGKPDVTLEYNFHQRLPEGEKYFNRTQPQQLNAQTLPPEFSLAAGHQIQGDLSVPLASFPAGDYRLEIKVTDKASSRSLTQNVMFTVLPS